MNKKEMKSLGIPSPNQGDSVMMLMTDYEPEDEEFEDINFSSPFG